MSERKDEIDKLSRTILERDLSILADDVKSTAGLKVYLNNYYQNLLDVAYEVYPTLLQVLGKKGFDASYVAFLDARPPKSLSIDRTADRFWSFLESNEGFGISQFARLDYLFTQAKTDSSLSASFERRILQLYLQEEPIHAGDLQISAPYQQVAITVSYDDRGNILLKMQDA